MFKAIKICRKEGELEMKAKKILVQVLIIALLAITFTSCGSNGGTTDGASNDGANNSGEPTFKLRLSTMGSPSDPLTTSAQRYADAVKEATNGDVEITVYNASQLGDSISVYGELMMGSIDLAWQTIPDTYDKRANAGMMPYICMDWDDVINLYSNKDLWFVKTLEEVNTSQGVTLLGLIPNGFMGIGAQKLGNLDTLFDLSKPQDALIRSASIDSLIAQVETFGFRVTTIPWADLYPALQTGVADGFYGGSAKSNYLGFKDVIKYFVEYKAVNEALGMLISTKTLESLPEEYQDLIIELAAEENLAAIEDMKAAEDQSKSGLEEFGVEIITPTDEELEAMATIVREKVYPLFEEDFGEELMDEIYTWVEGLD